MSFQPRTRLQKILMGIAATPRTALEHAVKYAVDHAGGGGGGELPDVSIVDDGFVLTVINGKWDKCYPTHCIYIDFNVTDGNYSTDVRISQINNMHNGEIPVAARFQMNNGVVKCPLIYADATTAIFSCVSYGESGTTKNVLFGMNDGENDTWQFITE